VVVADEPVEDLTADHRVLAGTADWPGRGPQVQETKHSALTDLLLELPESRDLGPLGQAQDRPELSFGVVGPTLTTGLQQEAEHGLGQPQQVQHLREPRPTDATMLGDLGLAVRHPAVEEPPELEALLDGALLAALGSSWKCSLRGNQGL
jgi:hypothetical protein